MDDADGCTVGTCSQGGALCEVLLHSERRRYVSRTSAGRGIRGTLVGNRAQESGLSGRSTSFHDDACRGRRSSAVWFSGADRRPWTGVAVGENAPKGTAAGGGRARPLPVHRQVGLQIRLDGCPVAASAIVALSRAILDINHAGLMQSQRAAVRTPSILGVLTGHRDQRLMIVRPVVPAGLGCGVSS